MGNDAMRIPAGSRLLAGSARRAAVAAALLPALALTAACGGGGKKPHAGPSGSVSAGTVTKALLTSHDVPDVDVKPATTKSELLGGAQKADPAACQPIADQWSDEPRHQRLVYAGGMVTDTAAKDRNAKTISLTVVAAYKPGDATTVLDDLTTALKTCRSYTTTRNGTTTTFTVRAVPATGHYGDQQVAYTIGDAKKGQAGTVLVTVVRVGDTTAAYETLRVDRKPAELRAAIPLKQAAKLRAANGS